MAHWPLAPRPRLLKVSSFIKWALDGVVLRTGSLGSTDQQDYNYGKIMVVEEALIIAVSESPILYDPALPEYKDKLKTLPDGSGRSVTTCGNQ